MDFKWIVALLLGFIAFLNVSNGITSDEIVAKLECVEYCHRTSHRSCLEVPNVCGKCMLSYLEIDGLCVTEGDQDTSIVHDLDNGIIRSQQDYRNAQKKSPSLNPGGGVVASGRSYDKVEMRRIEERYWDVLLIGILCATFVVLILALVLAICCVLRMRRNKAVKEMPYQTFYGTSMAPTHGAASGDRKLAYSAQMYHYQYQKQQMLASEKANGFEHKDQDGNSTDDEMVDEDDTVYECPGLANTEGEMEVTNPYFVDVAPENQPPPAAKQP